MKILLINSEFPPIGGGAGNASANIARLLVKAGHEVVVLTARYADLPHEEIRDGVRIVRVPSIRRKVDRSSANEQLSFILAGGLWTIKILLSFRPDVSLAFFGMPSGMISLGLKFFFRIPYVISLRGGDVPGFRPYDFGFYHKLIGPFLRVIWGQAWAVVANSDGLRQLAVQFDPNIPVRIIPNGVDLGCFAPVQREWEPPVILSVGRLVRQKGLDLAIRALASLQDINWRYEIAGDGPLRPNLELLANQLGIQGRVLFLGWQPSDKLPTLYQRANLFLFPSRHEGMPNAVLEAMASGLPVIATRIAGNEELVVSGETGSLVPAEDVDALRAALAAMLQGEDARREMGAASRRRVETHFAWEKVTEQYIQLLEKAVK
jgi:glycosyltransferase involved in cell wall biosynthesis